MSKAYILSLIYLLMPFAVWLIDVPQLACGYTDPCGLGVLLALFTISIYYGIFLICFLVIGFFLFRKFNVKTSILALVVAAIVTFFFDFMIVARMEYSQFRWELFLRSLVPSLLVTVVIMTTFHIFQSFYKRYYAGKKL